MTVYIPLAVGDKVSHYGPAVGTIVEIRPAKKPHIDDGDEAYVRWHRTYASWVKLHNLTKINPSTD